MNKKILYLYFIVSLLHLLAHLLGYTALINFSKPLLMPILSIYFLFSVGVKTLPNLLFFVALQFSFLGDVFLQYVGVSPNFFLIGLGAFLITQLLYTYVFFQTEKTEIGFLRKKPIMLLPFLVYLIVLLYFLLGKVPTEFIAPITIYGMVITAMASMALNLKGKILHQHWQTLFYGALLFVLSDSLIAINKFLQSLPYEGFLIMSTYIVAQFLIVEGFRKGTIVEG